MKQYFAILLCGLLGIGARAATETPDTLVDARDVHRVTVVQTDSQLNLTLIGQGTDSTYRHTFTHQVGSTTIENKVSGMNFNILPIPGKKKSSGSGSYGRPNGNSLEMHLPSIGFVTAIKAPEEMEVTMGRSVEVMWEIFTLCHHLANPRHSVSVGFGLDWRQWRLTGDTRFDKVDGRIVLSPYPEGADPHHSRVKVLSLFVPVRYSYHFSRHWCAALGAHFNLNTRASVKTLYRNADGVKVKDFYRGIHQRPFTADIVAQLGYRSVGIYAKYSPFHVFEKDRGPQFQSFTVGLCFNL